ncbi:DUF2530 domain-containing protein [Bifidobacterium phasiani]|uniref:DUF2530 domain-containing protein n=1 Tax=Bifidobacterium phasiani TaxID=2834431 RepID=A0ABS6WAT9_9BIFI|nr:DUF2530 domain-containing protein [Bifidobacterium phasiani]MBW3083623.1 DUF2530 domain-containing protein [Bifidobacterium phasiani]
MKFAPIIDPSARKPTPKPVRVDLRKAFTIGTILWILACAVSIVLQVLGIVPAEVSVVCVIGVVIGIMMLVWEHFDRWDYRRLGV